MIQNDPVTPLVVEHPRMPPTNDFKQQRLAAWNPTFDIVYVSYVFFIVSMISLPLAAILFAFRSGTVEIVVPYSDYQVCRFEDQLVVTSSNMTPPIPVGCPPIRIPFSLLDDVEGPIQIYYQMTNFYQNYYAYSSSRSDAQLYGETVTRSDLAACAPFDTMFAGRYLIYPCGAVAWSMFNDSFALYYVGSGPNTNSQIPLLVCDSRAFDDNGNAIAPNESVPVLFPSASEMCQKKGIAAPLHALYAVIPHDIINTDTVSHLGCNKTAADEGVSATMLPFLRHGWYANEAGHRIPNPVDEDFMVWMDIAAMPTFRKLFRYFTAEVTLPSGEYYMEVTQRFPTYTFGGSKALVLTNERFANGRDVIPVIGLCVTGAVSLVTFLSLQLARCRTSRQVGRRPENAIS